MTFNLPWISLDYNLCVGVKQYFVGALYLCSNHTVSMCVMSKAISLYGRGAFQAGLRYPNLKPHTARSGTSAHTCTREATQSTLDSFLSQVFSMSHHAAYVVVEVHNSSDYELSSLSFVDSHLCMLSFVDIISCVHIVPIYE